MKNYELQFLYNSLKYNIEDHRKNKDIIDEMPRINKKTSILYLVWNSILFISLPITEYFLLGMFNADVEYIVVTMFSTIILYLSIFFFTEYTNMVLMNFVNFKEDKNNMIKIFLNNEQRLFIENHFKVIDDKNNDKKKLIEYYEKHNISISNKEKSTCHDLIRFTEQQLGLV